jgi:cellulose synthase/poly-beta-1,6-N-acetylglucosamine synthase-like glycosyltransferase
MLLRFFFGLFLVYTWFYVLQWIVSLVITVYSLSRGEERKKLVKWAVPRELAQKHPVSVVIAAYNEEACVTDTIDSLLREDYPNLEIVLVDDGSRDGMARRVLEYYDLNRCPEETTAVLGPGAYACYCRELPGRRLIFLQKENGGKASALNCGLKLSTGRYCLVLDADTQVERGSIRVMVSRFLADQRTVVCAGAVGNHPGASGELSFLRKCLVRFQTLEYYRTFYMQRVLLDRFNANLVVSGAFAMFDRELLMAVGGYQENTIGEDMELSMRIHAFCQSQHRAYRIAYVPDAKCTTQLPMRYRDFFQQRRRWQIGMIQSLRRHDYMLINWHYGWAGMLAGFIFLAYELYAPFVELLGLLTLAGAALQGILEVRAVIRIMLIFYLLMVLMEYILIHALHLYKAEKIPLRQRLALLFTACAEGVSFHLIQSCVKVAAVLTFRKHSKTWKHINRARELTTK